MDAAENHLEARDSDVGQGTFRAAVVTWGSPGSVPQVKGNPGIRIS